MVVETGARFESIMSSLNVFRVGNEQARRQTNFLKSIPAFLVATILSVSGTLATASTEEDTASKASGAPASQESDGYGMYADGDYIIGVNDSIQVSVWRNPDLSVTVAVRPDGKISAPLVGDVVAAGRTPMQLADDVTKKLGTYIRNPQVSIIMAGLSSHEYLTRVRVTGAVATPASVTHQKGMTLLDLILDAGGINDFAAPNRTVVYRTDSNGKTKAIKVDLGDILKKGKLENNLVLQPGDVVSVPESFF